MTPPFQEEPPLRGPAVAIQSAQAMKRLLSMTSPSLAFESASWSRGEQTFGHLREGANIYTATFLVTAADWRNWNLSDLNPYLDVVLEAFGPQRLMVGSDWPVCLLATTPQNWFATIQEFIRFLSQTERQMILGEVATKLYSLDDTADVKP